MLQKIFQKFYSPTIEKLDREIGCKLVFRNIPSRFINGIVHCNMTKTWKEFGLAIEKGANYFTFGHVVNGDSSRFDVSAPEYQSWLGAYTLRLAPGASWAPRDHFKLAIADQNNWLRWYGDHHPMTSMEGWKLISEGPIQVGKNIGQLYDFGCTTHSDVGRGHNSVILFFVSLFLAARFNFSNSKLNLKAKALRPASQKSEYKILKLKGYIAIFDIKENVKIVFYGNGAVVHTEEGNIDTFEILKKDLLTAINSCEIVTM
jgi:hypothetical protein